MITGDHTLLRAPRESDLELLATLRNDVEVQRLLLARPRPNSAERVAEWVARLGDDPQSMLFVVASADDEPIGFVQITAMDFISGHCRLGIAIAPDHQGHGYGREALSLVARYVRATFDMHKIVLEVMADNLPAIGLYRATGFRDVGVLKRHFKHDGTWFDVVIMEWLLDP